MNSRAELRDTFARNSSGHKKRIKKGVEPLKQGFRTTVEMDVIADLGFGMMRRDLSEAEQQQF